mmetsp:Transcript_42722/g.106728  ORF Transcript_42722/g.106728 Transcript_42722/m.106728 type:complete len:242 (-) Transcript_42722:175-900(-)
MRRIKPSARPRGEAAWVLRGDARREGCLVWGDAASECVGGGFFLVWKWGRMHEDSASSILVSHASSTARSLLNSFNESSSPLSVTTTHDQSLSLWSCSTTSCTALRALSCEPSVAASCRSSPEVRHMSSSLPSRPASTSTPSIIAPKRTSICEMREDCFGEEADSIALLCSGELKAEDACEVMDELRCEPLLPPALGENTTWLAAGLIVGEFARLRTPLMNSLYSTSPSHVLSAMLNKVSS